MLVAEIIQITAHECNCNGVHGHKGFVAAQSSTRRMLLEIRFLLGPNALSNNCQVLFFQKLIQEILIQIGNYY